MIHKHTLSHRPNQDPKAFDRLKSMLFGTKLGLRTALSRSSISVTDMVQDLSWIRKSELPQHVLDEIEEGDAYAYLVCQQPPVIVISSSPLGLTKLHSFASDRTVPCTASPAEPKTPTQTTKGNTMTISSTITNAIEINKSAATHAAYLEAGRIANNQIVKAASKHLPLMARGYADTALGRLLIANAAMVAAAQLRPNDPTLKKLTMAMATAAYQQVIQSVDIEGIINSMLNSPEIKAAIDKMPKDDSHVHA